MRALLWSLAPMPAMLLAYLLAPPVVVGGVALASGAFVIFVVSMPSDALKPNYKPPRLRDERWITLP